MTKKRKCDKLNSEKQNSHLSYQNISAYFLQLFFICSIGPDFGKESFRMFGSVVLSKVEVILLAFLWQARIYKQSNLQSN